MHIVCPERSYRIYQKNTHRTRGSKENYFSRDSRLCISSFLISELFQLIIHHRILEKRDQHDRYFEKISFALRSLVETYFLIIDTRIPNTLYLCMHASHCAFNEKTHITYFYIERLSLSGTIILQRNDLLRLHKRT